MLRVLCLLLIYAMLFDLFQKMFRSWSSVLLGSSRTAITATVSVKAEAKVRQGTFPKRSSARFTG